MDLRHCERGRDEVCGGRVCRVGAGPGAGMQGKDEYGAGRDRQAFWVGKGRVTYIMPILG